MFLCLQQAGFLEQKPLAVLGPHLHQQIERCGIFDPFRDNLLFQPLRHVVQRFHEQAAAVIAGEVANKAAVDLQVIDVELLQVIERTEAGAEIIQCECGNPSPSGGG